MPKLEKWSVSKDNSNPFQAPELRSLVLRGVVSGHDRLEDGKTIRTSSIQQIDIKNRVAETRNTTYDLGEPCEEYVEWLADNGKSLEDYKDVLSVNYD